jgi:hypothetical protein
MSKPVKQKDIDYAENQYRKCLNLYGKDDQKTKLWRRTLLRINNRKK